MGNVKNGADRGNQRLFENINVFKKNQKHESNIVEITHLCIMHGVYTSTLEHNESKFTNEFTRFCNELSEFVNYLVINNKLLWTSIFISKFTTI